MSAGLQADDASRNFVFFLASRPKACKCPEFLLLFSSVQLLKGMEAHAPFTEPRRELPVVRRRSREACHCVSLATKL